MVQSQVVFDSLQRAGCAFATPSQMRGERLHVYRFEAHAAAALAVDRPAEEEQASAFQGKPLLPDEILAPIFRHDASPVGTFVNQEDFRRGPLDPAVLAGNSVVGHNQIALRVSTDREHGIVGIEDDPLDAELQLQARPSRQRLRESL